MIAGRPAVPFIVTTLALALAPWAAKAQNDPGQPALSPRTGPKIVNPMLVNRIEPEYTAEARAAGLQGSVVLYIEVTPDGTVENAQVIQSLGLGLDEKAIEAVQKWKFSPGKKDGKPVTVEATIEVNFRLL